MMTNKELKAMWFILINSSFNPPQEVSNSIFLQYSMANRKELATSHICAIVFFSLFAVSSVFGNGIVCIVLHQKKSLQTVTNLLLLHLSIAQILISLTIIPANIIKLQNYGMWILGKPLCFGIKFFETLTIFFSSYILLCVAAEKYWMTVKPLSAQFTHRKAYVMIGVVWSVSAVLATVCTTFVRLESQPVIFSKHMDEKGYLCQTIYPEHSRTFFIIFIFTFQYGLPLLLLIFAYVRVIYVLWRSSVDKNGETKTIVLNKSCSIKPPVIKANNSLNVYHARTNQNNASVHFQRNSEPNEIFTPTQDASKVGKSFCQNQHEADPIDETNSSISLPYLNNAKIEQNYLNIEKVRERKKKKAVIMIVVIMLLFFISWGPIHLFQLFKEVHVLSLNNVEVYQRVYFVCYWIAMSNVWYNPIIYCLFNERFRQAVRQLFYCPIQITITCERRKSGRQLTPTQINYDCELRPDDLHLCKICKLRKDQLNRCKEIGETITNRPKDFKVWSSKDNSCTRAHQLLSADHGADQNNKWHRNDKSSTLSSINAFSIIPKKKLKMAPNQTFKLRYQLNGVNYSRSCGGHGSGTHWEAKVLRSLSASDHSS